MSLALHVRRLLQKERVLHMGDTVICAVSGGPDSMALLHVMWRLAPELGVAVVAAHVNHGFREAESNREAELVRQYAKELEVRLEFVKLDVPVYAETHRMNAQAAARELRYRFLVETAERCGARVVMLAHHLDDQAETVLMNLLGGASLKGMSGMALRREEAGVQLIRPLLRIEKEEILHYVREQGVPYCVDSSNISRKYERNRLRLDVMPKLREFNPRLTSTLGQMADLLRDEDKYMEDQAELLASRIARHEGGNYEASRPDMLREPVALQRRLIQLILYYLSEDTRFPDYGKVESIRTAIASEAPPSLSLDVGRGIRFERRYDRLIWRVEEDGSGEGPAGIVPYAYEFEAVGGAEVRLPEVESVLRMDAWTPACAEMSPAGPDEALFDAELLAGPLVVRSRRDGDRIALLGMVGSRKVKDLLIDLKVDPDARNRLPLVVDREGKVLWIPGVRRSRHALISEETTRIIRMKLGPNPLNGYQGAFIR